MNKEKNKIQSITNLVMKSVRKLDVFLTDPLLNSINSKDIKVFNLHGYKGFCGQNIWRNEELFAQIHLATLKTSGFVIYRKIFDESNFQRYDYFNELGELIYSSQSLDSEVNEYQSINMDNTSPFINHIYNILNYEYEKMASGDARTRLVHYLESTLQNFFTNKDFQISANDHAKDFALKNILNEINRIELDPVIQWSERQSIFKRLKEVRKKIIITKSRVHRFNKVSYLLNILIQDFLTRLNLFKKRPWDNIKGIIYQLTIGNILWFMQTVRLNLGLSIAMAIYGPFTFYFITQPMNPHAMWAVGKVRNAYINALNSLEPSHPIKKEIIKDQVSTKMSSSLPQNPQKTIDWQTRMGDFKAMQIAFEANMVFAERMGRIEQMENQFSFPLTAESAWYEIERYITQVKADLDFYKNLDTQYKNFLNQEIERALKDQEYIWKKMAQFFLDHPFIVVDEEDKQTQKDYYTARAFVFMDKMTKKHTKLGVKIPPTHKKVFELARIFSQRRVKSKNTLEALKNNSKLFGQKDTFSSDELRDYMKRHWEVLFIQQNKKQEASSFGLQAYTWSIKNAIWCLQSYYSIKKEDIKTLSYKYNLENINTGKILSNTDINSQYEHLFHLLNIEYVSLKKEFSHNLRADNESTLRENLINRTKEFLITRDNLYLRGAVMAANTKGS